jgi:DNA-binding phage protein
LTMSGPCPDESEFVRLAEGRLDEESRRLLSAHVDDCAVCTELLHLLTDVAGECALGSTFRSSASARSTLDPSLASTSHPNLMTILSLLGTQLLFCVVVGWPVFHNFDLLIHAKSDSPVLYLILGFLVPSGPVSVVLTTVSLAVKTRRAPLATKCLRASAYVCLPTLVLVPIAVVILWLPHTTRSNRPHSKDHLLKRG